MGDDFFVEAELVVAILAELTALTPFAVLAGAIAGFFPLVATAFFADVGCEAVPMAVLEPLATLSNFFVGVVFPVRTVGFFVFAKGFLGTDLVFFEAFKVGNS